MPLRKPCYFPLYLSLAGRKCLVVGGGKVAERKIRAIIGCLPELHVIAPDITPGIRKLTGSGALRWHCRKFRKTDIRGCCLVFAATSDAALNVRIASDCSENGIPVNVAKPGDAGSFIVPAVITEGDIAVAVSTMGNSPIIAGLVRDEFRDRLKKYDKLLKILKPYRRRLLTGAHSSEYNNQLLREFFRHPLMTWIEKGETFRVKELAEKLFRATSGK